MAPTTARGLTRRMARRSSRDVQTATETNSRAAGPRLHGYCLGGSFGWLLEHVVVILGWGFEALQRIELLICQFSCFNVQVGVTKALMGDYVPRPGNPSSTMRWYLLDYTFIMELGEAVLPRPPIK